MRLDILYSDQTTVVINKPAGLLSVPGRGPGKQDSAVNRIREIFSGCIEQPSVHRLDMDTSGLMVFALTSAAHRNISIQFQEGLVHKKYIAVLEGLLSPELGGNGRIELWFRLDTDNRPRQIPDKLYGKKGITLWKKLDENGERSRVEFEPLTGRTHQLRLHAAHPVDITGGINRGGLGCPIAGDRLYGSSSDSEHEQGVRMLLHASELEFLHPDTHERFEFKNQPPF